jgi:hypothetical protein
MFRAAVVLAIAAVLSAPAHASRSCLDKNEAARTWPGRVLAIDDDACWTYFRRGLKPAPVDDSVNDRAANAQPTIPPDMREWSNSMAAMPEISPAAQATTVDRPLARHDRGAAEAGVRRTTATVDAQRPPRHRHRHAVRCSGRGRLRRHQRTAQARNTRPVLHVTFKGTSKGIAQGRTRRKEWQAAMEA